MDSNNFSLGTCSGAFTTIQPKNELKKVVRVPQRDARAHPVPAVHSAVFSDILCVTCIAFDSLMMVRERKQTKSTNLMC